MKALTNANPSHGLSMGSKRLPQRSLPSSRAYILLAVLAGGLYAALTLLVLSSGSNAVFRLVSFDRIAALKSPRLSKDKRSEFGWKHARVDLQSTPTWQWLATQLS